MAQGFAQKSAGTVESMARRTQAFTDALTDTGTRMAETISARAEEVNSTLRSTGDSLVLDLCLRGGDVVSKLEQTGARITDTIDHPQQRGVRNLPRQRRGAGACAQ